jgi:hypothetical protein
MSKRTAVPVVLAVALCFTHSALAAPAAPGSVEPSTTPAAPPAATPPAATPPATTAPAATAPEGQPSTETAKPKSDAKARRRVVRQRYRYRYAYRDPFYYWHPRFWWPFRPYRYRVHRYPRRYAYHRYHRRHYRGGPFSFRW